MKNFKTSLLVAALIFSAFALQAFRPAIDAENLSSIQLLADSTDVDSLAFAFLGDSTESDSLSFAFLNDSTETDSLFFAFLSDSTDADSMAFAASFLNDSTESDSLMFMVLGDSTDVDSLFASSLLAFAGDDTTKDGGCDGDKEKKELINQFAFKYFASDSTDVDSLSAV